PGYSLEMSLGGPIPFLENTFFHLSGKYRTVAPVMGNSYRDKGEFLDGTAKLTFNLSTKTKLLVSGFLGTEETSWGIGGGPDYFWATTYGNDSRDAFYDFPGYPTTRTWGVTAKLTSILDDASLVEVKLSNVTAIREVGPFPDDPLGYAASYPVQDNLRALETIVDADGNVITRPAIGGYENKIGYNTTGYYYRYADQNTDWTINGYYQRQLTQTWQVKSGVEFTYYVLDHYNEAKSPVRVDSNVYKPYQGAAYAQTKLELGGFILNAGLRYDFYNPNDVIYLDIFNPLLGPTEKSDMFSQLSLRLGVSHPIDEYTVLHFSYGHFFQRSTFGDYGEGSAEYQALGNLTTFIISGTTNPWVLGNRALRPEKTIAFELGVERNFFEEFVVGVTGFYKDIRNTVSIQTVDNLPTLFYTTNGNYSYADVTGLEVFLRKQATQREWGTLWG
ncbi:TonB-dependent receptor, partial [bacterium]|nr:TonB-dependent receptor [bacterium]